jgi:hypothetical protein
VDHDRWRSWALCAWWRYHHFVFIFEGGNWGGHRDEWPIIPLADAKPVIVLRNNTDAFFSPFHKKTLPFKKRFIETWLGID